MTGLTSTVAAEKWRTEANTQPMDDTAEMLRGLRWTADYGSAGTVRRAACERMHAAQIAPARTFDKAGAP